jgi:hypothetical protein
MLYEIWTGTPERTPTTELAAQLVQSPEVRKRASPALRAVLDLRSATGCADVLKLLPRVAKDADERAVRPLARLLRRTGCGAQGGSDCYACLRHKQTLNQTIAAVQKRPARASGGK